MRRTSSSRPAPALAATVLLAASGAAAVVPAQAAGRLVANLQASGHHPRVNQPWPIRITARTPNGKAVQANVRYSFLFNGQVVARRSNYRFRGTFHDNLTWPASALGHRLTFRAVVTSRVGNQNLDYWVQVRR